MSLQIFKANMLRYMQNQEGIQSSDDFATTLTNEYDLMVKRGFQTINNIPVQTGNKQSMESLAKIACKIALTVRSGNHTFIDDLGKAIVMYWTGATLVIPAPPPITPAIGALANVASVKAFVSNPGQWSPIGPTPPIDDSNIFLDTLIGGIQSHLLTIEFFYETVSIYPTSPIPLPGILQSTGYTIPG